jgi:hypothetical protein
MVSLAAQALPGSPAPAQVAAFEVMTVSSACWDGFHRSRATGRCVSDGVTYAGPQAFGLPYVEPLAVRLPYVELPPVRLPYAELPTRLPYVELPVLGGSRACPNGYSYYPAYRRCAPI